MKVFLVFLIGCISISLFFPKLKPILRTAILLALSILVAVLYYFFNKI